MTRVSLVLCGDQEKRMRAYDALHARNRLAQTIATLGASRKSKSTTKIVKVHALLMHVVCTAIAVCLWLSPCCLALA